MPTKTIKVPQRLTREAVTKAAVDGETVTMSISSDVPYLRESWFDEDSYYEVLDHSPGGVDEERLKAGLPILYNHDRDALIGRGIGYVNDGHKITVTAKFSESPLAREKFADVKSAVLVDTSVGYEIIGDGTCIGAKDELPIYKFKFKVYEGSLVSIPADATVGVGRYRSKDPDEKFVEVKISLDESGKPLETKNVSGNLIPPKPAMKISNAARAHFLDKDTGGGDGGGGTAPGIVIDLKKERADALAEFKARCKKIDDFVAGVKNEAWRAKAAEVAAKHKDGEAIFDDFRAEALNHFTTETQLDTVEHGKAGGNGNGSGIQVIGERELSIGAQFVRSKEFLACGGRLEKGSSVKLDIPGLSTLGIRGKVAMAQRAGFTSADLAPVNVQIQPAIVGLGMQRLTIMDVLAPGTIGAGALIYPRENSFGTVDGVAVAAGAFPRAKAVGERGVKPNWDADLTTKNVPVKKVAITTKVPDEFMADFPAAQSFIDQRLPYMVDLETEFQILYGDGLNNNLDGIFNQQGVQTRAVDGTNDSTVAISLKKGLTDIQVNAQFEPDFYAFHPYDWETASLLRDSQNRFLAGGPFYIPYTNGVFMEMNTFWGKPVVITTSVTYGKPIAGAGKLGAQYFIREGMRIEMTNSNEDDFKRNLIALRAEHRLLVATYRPVAFLEFTGFPART